MLFAAKTKLLQYNYLNVPLTQTDIRGQNNFWSSIRILISKGHLLSIFTLLTHYLYRILDSQKTSRNFFNFSKMALLNWCMKFEIFFDQKYSFEAL